MQDVDYLRFVLVLGFLIGLILLAGAIVRKYGPGGLTAALARGTMGRGRPRRLRIIETAVIGPKHRLVLIARDDTEHLLVLGGDGAVVVERDLSKPRFTLPDDVAPAPPSPDAPTAAPGTSQTDAERP